MAENTAENSGTETVSESASEAAAEVKSAFSNVKAKDTSHIAMIVSGAWIMVLTVLKACSILKIDEGDIIESGIAIAGVFSPVYFSMLMDKIKDIRMGSSAE